MPNHAEQLAAELNLSVKNVQGAIELIDQGNTIPFIARYRKEATGSMDDQVLRNLGDRLEYLRGLDKRKEEVTASITEQGAMTPELTAALAHALDVSSLALTVPDIDSDLGLMHTLFALEDTYGLRVEAADGEICLGVDTSQGARAASLREMLRAWREQAAKLEAGEITREEYDRWRYHYPEFDTTGAWHKMSPSQELGDGIVNRSGKRTKRGK